MAAVAQQSRERSRSTEEFLEVLNGRINALANTHAFAEPEPLVGVGLDELVRTELAFCTSEESTHIEGPKVELAAEAAQPVAMVLHELATNAAKYGALSMAMDSFRSAGACPREAAREASSCSSGARPAAQASRRPKPAAMARP